MSRVNAPKWVAGDSYPRGFLARWNNTLLRCQEAHESSKTDADPWGSLRAPTLATRWRVDHTLMRHEAGVCGDDCPVVRCVRKRRDAA